MVRCSSYMFGTAQLVALSEVGEAGVAFVLSDDTPVPYVADLWAGSYRIMCGPVQVKITLLNAIS